MCAAGHSKSGGAAVICSSGERIACSCSKKSNSWKKANESSFATRRTALNTANVWKSVFWSNEEEIKYFSLCVLFTNETQ